MTAQKNIQIVQSMYAAFAKNDVPSIMEVIAEDCEWGVNSASSEVPWLRSYRGKATIPNFFKAMAEEITFTKFNPHTFTATDDHVTCLVDWAGTNKRTQKSAQTTATHHFTFKNGRVTQFFETSDTAQSINAYQAGTTPYDLQTIARTYMDCLDRRDLETLNTLFVQNVKLTGLGPSTLDNNGVRETMSHFFKAFPDSRMPIDGVIANNNEVAIRHRFEGTHKDTFMGVAPTNKRVSVTGTVTLRITDGKITEGVVHADMLGLLVQLGTVTAPKMH